MVRWGGGAGRCGFTQRFSITDRAIGVAAVQDVLAIDDIEPACDDYGCADPDAFGRQRPEEQPAIGNAPDQARIIHRHHRRSEEHTSELQSLMRISYAVFCLKKKTKERQT